MSLLQRRKNVKIFSGPPPSPRKWLFAEGCEGEMQIQEPKPPPKRQRRALASVAAITSAALILSCLLVYRGTGRTELLHQVCGSSSIKVSAHAVWFCCSQTIRHAG